MREYKFVTVRYQIVIFNNIFDMNTDIIIIKYKIWVKIITNIQILTNIHSFI